MPRVSFTARAEHDVNNILEYTIAEWGKEQAGRYLDVLEARLSALAENPKAGKKRDEVEPKLMSFPAEKHTVYYIPSKSGISIIRILHSSMDPLRHL